MGKHPTPADQDMPGCWELLQLLRVSQALVLGWKIPLERGWVNSGLSTEGAAAPRSSSSREEQPGGTGRGGHTRSSAEGGNSRILLEGARDGLSDRKEAEAASKQKRDMLKPTGQGTGTGRAHRDLLGETAGPTCC